MAFSDITDPASVRSAIREFNELGRDEFLERYGFGPSYTYFLAFEGRHYDSKAVLGAAHGYQFPDEGALEPGAFGDGDSIVRQKLEDLGFSVDVSPAALEFPPRPSRVWVEVAFGPREGDVAVGRALWSPTAGKGNRDIYRFMREVRMGDAVLHLTDGKGFTGVSRAAASFLERTVAPDSESEAQPSYVVRLRDYQHLSPPLLREIFFNESRFGDRLVELLEDHRNLFYERGLQLHQGAYLTPVPPAVLRVLEDAYQTVIEDAEQTASARAKLVREDPERAHSISDWLASTHGLTYSPASVAAFLTALQTKGLVILGGVSGTGKTKLAQSVSQLIAEDEGDQHVFVSVRPDWRDSRSLIGYLNPLSGIYESTPLLRLLTRSRFSGEGTPNEARVSGTPYFVTLDEMNLARPEYYFAEFLSVLESGRDEHTGLTREALALHDPREEPVKDASGTEIPEELDLAPNLYFVGTINIDETTHGLSPKVLDRAFTLEIDDIEFGKAALPDAPQPEGFALRAAFTRGGRFARIDRDVVKAFVNKHPNWVEWLQTLSDQLRPYDLHFAYRSFDEIAMFTMNAAVAPWFDGFGHSELAAFDVACVAKVLPRFSGVRARLRQPLVVVLAWAVNPDTPDVEAIEEVLNLSDRMPAEAVLPAVASKAHRMLQRLETTGFASYA